MATKKKETKTAIDKPDITSDAFQAYTAKTIRVNTNHYRQWLVDQIIAATKKRSLFDLEDDWSAVVGNN